MKLYRRGLAKQEPHNILVYSSYCSVGSVDVSGHDSINALSDAQSERVLQQP